MVTGNRYLPRGSKENALSTIITGNVTKARWVALVITTPVFGFCHDSVNLLNSVTLGNILMTVRDERYFPLLLHRFFMYNLRVHSHL